MFRAANDTRLLGPHPWMNPEPAWDWSIDWLRMAARSQEFICNDPFASSMLACKLDNTHGPEGLRPTSQAQYDTTKPVDQADHDLRQTLEAAYVRQATRYFDVSGQLTRRQFDRQLDWLATVLGEGFAVRVELPPRHGSLRTCWRLVRPDRVSTPEHLTQDSSIYHGIKLGKNREPIGIWVETTEITSLWSYAQPTWTYIPWTAEDGTPNVVHRVGWKLPGMIRGISMYAPILLMAKQVGGVFEAHVVGKRAQATTPVIYYVENPVEAAKAARASAESIVGPHTKFNTLQVYFAKLGSQVDFKQVQFSGDDFDKFIGIAFRVLCSVWQLPVEVVLCKMGEASLASARAGLDQVDRTAQTWQNDHIEQASSMFEHGTVSELVRYDDLKPGPSGITGLLLNRYRRPPKYSTDRQKDANTIETLVENGVSPTSALAMFGWDYEDETDQSIRDERYRIEARKAAGLNAPAAPAEPPAVDDDDAEDKADEAAEKTGQALTLALAAIDRLAARQPSTGPMKIERNKDGTLTVSEASPA